MRCFRSPAILLGKMVLATSLSCCGLAFAAPPTLKEAVEAAWAKRPEAQSLSARQDELAARRDAASSLFPAPPSFGVSQRSDRYNNNRGDRETEAEVAIPLWMPGTRSSAQRLANAETSYLDIKTQIDKLRTAEQVRDAYWQARFAQNDHDLAVRKASEAAVLLQDVERRHKAGDLARTDFNQTASAERLARSNAAEAEIRAARALRIFTLLTGFSQLPEAGEALAGDHPNEQDLPQLVALASTVQVQEARLQQVAADRRAPPELAVGVIRERPAYSDSYENSMRFTLRIPLATQARNAPRIAAANAELIEAKAAFGLERDRIQAEVDAAKAELVQAQIVEKLAQERFQLATDTQSLHAKAFHLGEVDLITRLRSENERFDSELALSRARLDVGRAISRINQALGLLP